MPRLYVVATPIGNLNDLSPRMREALETCDLIAAEDTRVTLKLLQVLGIHKPMVSCHRHNEEERKDDIIEKMLSGDLTVALTCDAGTPGISDPGEQLVAAAWEAGIPVTPVCGPSAMITALSASGFDTREFAFYGFLPRENKDLKTKLLSILKTRVPIAVLHESPHRICELLEAISVTLPGARVCVCCDLTKKYERIDRGEVSQVLKTLQNTQNVEKGEYCVVLDLSAVPAPQEEAAAAQLSPEQMIVSLMLEGMSLNDACARLRDSGIKRNDIYRAKLALSRLEF